MLPFPSSLPVPPCLLKLLLNTSNHYKSFFAAFPVENILYGSSISETAKKSPVKLRKKTHSKEIGRKILSKTRDNPLNQKRRKLSPQSS